MGNTNFFEENSQRSVYDSAYRHSWKVVVTVFDANKQSVFDRVSLLGSVRLEAG